MSYVVSKSGPACKNDIGTLFFLVGTFLMLSGLLRARHDTSNIVRRIDSTYYRVGMF